MQASWNSVSGAVAAVVVRRFADPDDDGSAPHAGGRYSAGRPTPGWCSASGARPVGLPCPHVARPGSGGAERAPAGRARLAGRPRAGLDPRDVRVRQGRGAAASSPPPRRPRPAPAAALRRGASAACCSCCRRWTPPARTARSGTSSPGSTRRASTSRASRCPAARRPSTTTCGGCTSRARRAAQIGVFNRSHYEDVLVVRVKDARARGRGERRYRHIREFERMLVDEGTTVVKCLPPRLEGRAAPSGCRSASTIPEKRWKFRARRPRRPGAVGRVPARVRGRDRARRRPRHAPWYVVPADRNWVRNLAVAKILLHTLEQIDPQLPPAEPGLEQRDGRVNTGRAPASAA